MLQNGKVLAIGGAGVGSATFANVDLYDPTANSWAPVASMGTPRTFHTATRLNDGRVLVTGGVINQSSTVLNSVELYDPNTNSWSAASPMNAAREQHTATLLSNGKVLITGGFTTGFAQLASAEVYDPTTNVWSAAPSMSITRIAHRALRLNGGQILITGGIIGGPSFGSTAAETYDPTSNTWTNVANMNAPRAQHTVTLLGDGRVLVTGGRGPGAQPVATAEIYNPGANTWANTPNMSVQRAIHTATLLNSGEVLVAGGMNSDSASNCSTCVNSSAERFNPSTNSWTNDASMNSRRQVHEAVLLGNGAVLVIEGGQDTPINVGAPGAEVYSGLGTPAAQIDNIVATINGFNLAGTVSGGQGITNALNSKLASVDADLAMVPPDTSGACSTLNAFINQVNAQRGNKLTVSQADSLLASANQLKTSIPCP